MFREIRADYRRHGSSILNPALWAVVNYRFGVRVLRLRLQPLRWLGGKIYGLNLFLILITSGIRLYRETKIGSDFHLIHSGNISIHPDAVIGDRCGIQQDVTIGMSMGPGVPVIGDDVYIGAGAKVLGRVSVGDGAVIAANSLVISDVPPRSTAIGVPARVWGYSAVKRQRADDGDERAVVDRNKGTVPEPEPDAQAKGSEIPDGRRVVRG